jgi:hypothetical protein
MATYRVQRTFTPNPDPQVLAYFRKRLDAPNVAGRSPSARSRLSTMPSQTRSRSLRMSSGCRSIASRSQNTIRLPVDPPHRHCGSRTITAAGGHPATISHSILPPSQSHAILPRGGGAAWAANRRSRRLSTRREGALHPRFAASSESPPSRTMPNSGVSSGGCGVPGTPM